MDSDMTTGGEELLHDGAEQMGLTERTKEQARETLQRTKARLSDAQEAVTYQSRRAAQYTDTYVHDNTWQSIAIAAGFGLVLGLLLRRR